MPRDADRVVDLKSPSEPGRSRRYGSGTGSEAWSDGNSDAYRRSLYVRSLMRTSAA
jgi:hypothetical protein